MKNILFFLALAFAFMPCLAGAQTISKDADGNYFAASTAKETGLRYTGNAHKISHKDGSNVHHEQRGEVPGMA